MKSWFFNFTPTCKTKLFDYIHVTECIWIICTCISIQYWFQCDTIVAQYGPVIAELFSQLLDPKKICQVFQHCHF